MAMKSWGLGRKWWGLGAGARFFVSLAVISLVPVVALGAILAHQYRGELRDRGIAQGQLQAALISRLITDTQLHRENLLDGVSLDERTSLDRLADTEVDSGIITRFRLRTPDLRVVYSSDGSGLRFGPRPRTAPTWTRRAGPTSSGRSPRIRSPGSPSGRTSRSSRSTLRCATSAPRK